MNRVAQRFNQQGPSSAEAWAKLRKLADGDGIINLGQGFPDFVAIPEAIEHAKRALDQPMLNQYAAMGGSLRLKTALSSLYGDLPSREISSSSNDAKEASTFNPLTEITITTSGTEAVYCTMQALVNPGDVVLVFEPSFPWYIPAIRLAGGTPITIELQPPHFSLLQKETKEKVLAAFSGGEGGVVPKIIVCNTPHNPTGHVLSSLELDLLEELALRHECLVVSDEVYERCLFEGHELISPKNRATLASRTITIGSSSKLLSVTGWRVGWCCGAADIVRAIKMSSGYTTFCAPAPLQEACAVVIEESVAKGKKMIFFCASRIIYMYTVMDLC